LGRLTFPVDQFDEMLLRMGFDPLPIQPAHGILAGGLPRHHDDPFDRLLVAQALAERLTLVSADETVRRYDVQVL
jgi:PIN domain nuclease of toxin-antitoxin system